MVEAVPEIVRAVEEAKGKMENWEVEVAMM